jgi:hypothetical protein
MWYVAGMIIGFMALGASLILYGIICFAYFFVSFINRTEVKFPNYINKLNKEAGYDVPPLIVVYLFIGFCGTLIWPIGIIAGIVTVIMFALRSVNDIKVKLKELEGNNEK